MDSSTNPEEDVRIGTHPVTEEGKAAQKRIIEQEERFIVFWIVVLAVLFILFSMLYDV